MNKRIRFLFLFVFLMAVPIQSLGGDSGFCLPTLITRNYSISSLVPGANLYGGTNGLAFDAMDRLYVGSVAGGTIFNVNTRTGDSRSFLGPPRGGADDIVFGPDGRMYWTAFFLGKVFSVGADGNIVLLADNMPGANALAFNEKGELYVSQVFFGDALWKIDTTGNMNNVKIAGDLGGLNGFDFGRDGYLYGPLWFEKQVVKVDVSNGVIIEVIADGFSIPCAVNFDSKENLFALDSGTGEIFQVNVNTGRKKVIAIQEPHLDNLSFDSNDRMFITNMNSNGVYEVNIDTGKIRTITEDSLVYPQGIAVLSGDSGEFVYVADNFAYKKIDGFSGKVICPDNGARFVYTCSISADEKHVVMSGWSDDWIQVYDIMTDALEYKITGVPKPTDTHMLFDGSLLVLEGVSGRLVQIKDGDYKSAEVIAEGLDFPTYMAPAVSDKHIIYITEFGSGEITSVNIHTGNKKNVYKGLSGPEGIAVRRNGSLLVVDSVSKSLLEINPETGASEILVVNLPVGLKGASKGGPPASPLTDVAVSESGNVYIASAYANTIFKLSPSVKKK